MLAKKVGWKKLSVPKRYDRVMSKLHSRTRYDPTLQHLLGNSPTVTTRNSLGKANKAFAAYRKFANDKRSKKR